MVQIFDLEIERLRRQVEEDFSDEKYVDEVCAILKMEGATPEQVQACFQVPQCRHWDTL